MTDDFFQCSSLLFGTAKTLEFNSPDSGFKRFVKNKLDDFQATTFKVNGALDPKFDFVINTEPTFFGIMTNEIGSAAENHHIPIFHPEEICGVRMDSKTMGAL
jgi:hypothetical protein